MAAIISEKFRIFNAKQFLESLSEGANDADAARTRMYFFVGRSAKWDAYIEVFNVDGTFAAGETVSGGGWSATVAEVNENSLLVNNVLPTATTTPSFGTTITGGTSSATAKSGVYRYATEEAPPAPIDNYSEKIAIYNELIAAKRITGPFARLVIPRYNWNISLNPKFDMYRPSYAPTPGGGGAVGKSTATGQTSLSDGKFYVMNSNYEVFKCLYNGENPANPTGQNATYEPKSQPAGGQGAFSNGIYTEPSGTAGYIWKHMFTLPTADVLSFLSTDFLPIVEKTEASRVTVEGQAVVGGVHVAVVEDAGTALPATATLYTPVYGDGSNAIVKFTTDGSGSITTAEMEAAGTGYTYGSTILETGKVFTDAGLTSAASSFTGKASIEVVISPSGGHGSDAESELFSKRVMTNIRLTYDEGSGDFPVDNDFRRIGIIQDPFDYGTTNYASASTLRGTAVLKVNGATSDYTVDEDIFQSVTGGTAYGKVVSWDSGTGILKYYQSPELHSDSGVVRAFESNAANAVVGQASTASGNIDTGATGAVSGITFTGGLASPEIAANSGEIVYIENRRQITRAADQIEDIKLVIEF
tara:strand:- start:549 stop:2309 length:1761 start_codon:yes stop_codon:yes gene_type:complete